nr:hypothetical protein Q903MT_gene2502 [Picea sitchensis]
MCVNRFSYPNHEEVTIAEPHYDRPSTHYPLPHSVQYALPSTPFSPHSGTQPQDIHPGRTSTHSPVHRHPGRHSMHYPFNMHTRFLFNTHYPAFPSMHSIRSQFKPHQPTSYGRGGPNLTGEAVQQTDNS